MKLKIFISTFLFMIFLGLAYFKHEELGELKKKEVPLRVFKEMKDIKKLIKSSDLNLKNEKIFSSRINRNFLKGKIDKGLKDLGEKYNLKNFKLEFLREKSYDFINVENLEKPNFLETQVSFEAQSEKDIYSFLDDSKKICGINFVKVLRIKNLKVLMLLRWNFLPNETKNFISIRPAQFSESLKNVSSKMSSKGYCKDASLEEVPPSESLKDASLKKVQSSESLKNVSSKMSSKKDSSYEIYLFSHRPQHALLCILNNSAYIVTTSISDHKVLEKKWVKIGEFIGKNKIEKINTKTITITINNKCRRINLGERWF